MGRMYFLNKDLLDDKLIEIIACKTQFDITFCVKKKWKADSNSKFRNLATEIWNFENNEVTNVNQSIPSGKYNSGFGLYLVPDNFCSEN